MSFSERLKLAMENAGYTQGKLAKEVGMAQSSVWKLVSGGADGSRNSVKIATTLGVRPEWLTAGKGSMYEDDRKLPSADSHPQIDPSYRVDVLDIQASAGSGTYQSSEFIETIRAIEYSNEQAQTLFGNRPPSSVKVITVRGDSMEGTIEPGDQLFLDTFVTHFDGDGIYVFVFGKTLHVKRLQMQKDALLVISDNPRYREWYINEEDEDQFHILAKVLLRQSIEYKRFA